jgi:hypothetical protein
MLTVAGNYNLHVAGLHPALLGLVPAAFDDDPAVGALEPVASSELELDFPFSELVLESVAISELGLGKQDSELGLGEQYSELGLGELDSVLVLVEMVLEALLSGHAAPVHQMWC